MKLIRFGDTRTENPRHLLSDRIVWMCPDWIPTTTRTFSPE